MAKKIDARARWIYNARDCAATIGAYNVLRPMMDEWQHALYRAQITLEAVALAVSCRGIKVDTEARKRVLKNLDVKFAETCNYLSREAGITVNPNSPAQINTLFYGTLGLKEQKNKDGKVSVDREVLERISKERVDLAVAQPRGHKAAHLRKCAGLADLVLQARGIAKDRGMVKAHLDNGRIRSSINVGATESFRFSASKTNFGRGANLQQVKPEIREMMIADEGMEMVYGDQDRAESTAVAYISGDPKYVAAHRAHDTHVEVAKLIWPEEPWPGTDEGDALLAGEPNFIRHYSRRDMSKRTQHALNYYPPGPLRLYKLKGPGPHHTLSRMLQIEKKLAYEITCQYFDAFPGIQDWQQEVIEQVKTYRRVFYPGGFYRDLFGRSQDGGTQREAISSIPQFVVAWTNHYVFAKLWELYDEPGVFEMLMHNHDAVLFQCTSWAEWEPIVRRAVEVEWPGREGPFTIPWSFDAGPNWMEAS